MKLLLWCVVLVAGVHGYIYLVTQKVHPCEASQVRLVQRYGMKAVELITVLGMGAVFGDKNVQNSPTIPQWGREILAKAKALEPLGAAGCYWPALLGWDTVPVASPYAK